MKINFAAVLFLSLLTSAASAKGLVFSDASILVPLKGSNVTAGYGIIKNDSDAAVTLEITEVKPFKAVEMHETTEANGKMSMHKIAQVKIPAHQSFELKPGGNHIMLFDASREVKAGEQLTVTFKVDGKATQAPFKVMERQK